MKKPPETIYLQWYGPDEDDVDDTMPHDATEVTWCKDQIFESDPCYRIVQVTGVLWAVHVKGPDDIIACRRLRDAWELVESLEPLIEGDPPVIAEVIEWPYGVEAHRDALEKLEKEGGYKP